MAATQLVTLEDLDRLATGDERVEILGGELYEMPPANPEHGGIAFNIATLVMRTTAARQRLKGFTAETPFRLRRDPQDVVVPGVAFVRRDRLPPIEERIRVFEGPPDIAVEVISPSDRPAVVALKIDRYLNADTPSVWLVDPAAKSITVFAPGRDAVVYRGDHAIDLGDIVPGLTIAVADVFSD